jgi:hypothetical protein
VIGEDGVGSYRRREITLHSFRRFVKTTLSDLGYSDTQNGSLDISALHTGVKRNQRKLSCSERLNLI